MENAPPCCWKLTSHSKVPSTLFLSNLVLLFLHAQSRSLLTKSHFSSSLQVLLFLSTCAYFQQRKPACVVPLPSSRNKSTPPRLLMVLFSSTPRAPSQI
ncbi:hypothetical protein LR48_Vigan62s000100 [Vigna angularis]|uniref:Uncharacterized protein n=2 Tax=Phaseolus angularis TaxID=3914 RepID=A0A0L9T542_PHAAN|nr:hypothetical protein LR48_Vigan62s000100 [Vigna angularis]BAT84013.1 hypothetical protein VIGAN_04127500 [Vigna angularis var. angularis]